MNTLVFLALFGIILGSSSVLAGNEGGGGDSLEIRINEIRADILNWIEKGGAKGLKLPNELSYEEYYFAMTNALQPQAVVVGLIEEQIVISGVHKTCKNFISEDNSRPHILCNISRFKDTPESEQYKLIHHEFAGLVNVENNHYASSDYQISSQITEYLTRQVVLKLSIKKNSSEEEKTFYSGGYASKVVGSCKEARELAINYAKRKCFNAGFENCNVTNVFKLSSGQPFWPRTDCYYNAYVKGSHEGLNQN